MQMNLQPRHIIAIVTQSLASFMAFFHGLVPGKFAADDKSMELASNMCSVVYCGRTYGCGGKASLFRFPKDDDRCRQWAIACGILNRFEAELRHNRKLYDLSIRVCDKHFTPDSFCNTEGKRKHLKRNAVPTLRLRRKIAAVQRKTENPEIPPAELPAHEPAAAVDAAEQPPLDRRDEQRDPMERLAVPGLVNNGLPEAREERRPVVEANRLIDEANRLIDEATRLIDEVYRLVDEANHRADNISRECGDYRRQLEATFRKLYGVQNVAERRKRTVKRLQQRERRLVARVSSLKTELRRVRGDPRPNLQRIKPEVKAFVLD